MNSSICTLFEGHYHFGVAALINSLSAQGFRGNIYVGFRGNLPDWANKSEANSLLNWRGAKTLYLITGIKVHFLPLDTNYHFTNYKPTFVLRLINEIEKEANNIFYFDPDIVIKCNWQFFEKWVSFGVTLVHEIISNDMPPSHPIRQEWKKIILDHGRDYKRDIHSYINAGFFGVTRENLEFVELYKEFIEISVNEFEINVNSLAWTEDRTNPFFANDQDALNIAAMCTNSPISEVGPDGMDFTQGGFLMSHSIGSPKPWEKNYLLSSINGIPPSLADRAYWNNSNGIIKTKNSNVLKLKILSFKIAYLIGRFYKRY